MTVKESITHSISNKVTLENIKFWFDALNDYIFNGELVFFDDVRIKRTRGYLGMVLCYSWDIPVIDQNISVKTYDLIMRSNQNFKTFLSTLGHEMVHLYQSQVLAYDSMPEPNRDKIFYEFQKKFDTLDIDII